MILCIAWEEEGRGGGMTTLFKVCKSEKEKRQEKKTSKETSKTSNERERERVRDERSHTEWVLMFDV